MAHNDFVDVVIRVNHEQKTVKMQKGCSFENNGAIYRMNNDGLLSVFDKSSQQWAGRKEITMTGYQFDTFQAVANNVQEKGQKGIVFSKADIDKAVDFFKNNKLTNDISEFLRGGYKAENVKAYSKDNAFSAYVNNGNNSTSGNLIFKYGEAARAVDLSKIVNKVVDENKTHEPKKAENKVQSAKAHNDKTQNTSPKLTKNKKKTGELHHSNRAQSAELPYTYKKKLDNIIKSMKIDEAAFNNKVKHTAKKTGYSEYFIKYIISVEEYEPSVRNTNDGTITGGFGHSKLRDKSLKAGQKVSADKAFKWLESDIKFFEGKLKALKVDSVSRETIGDYWKKLPLSMKEAMIDVAFNRDHRKLQDADEYKSLRANIKGGEEYLPASAVRLRQDFSQYSYKQKLSHQFTTGLMHRNCYRFLLAIRDFDDNYRKIAKQRFENAGNYYTETLKLLRAKGYATDAKRLEQAWNAM